MIETTDVLVNLYKMFANYCRVVFNQKLLQKLVL